MKINEFAASSAQEDMWLAVELDANRPAFNVPYRDQVHHQAADLCRGNPTGSRYPAFRPGPGIRTVGSSTATRNIRSNS
jgi:hypothetical protein